MTSMAVRVRGGSTRRCSRRTVASLGDRRRSLLPRAVHVKMGSEASVDHLMR